MVKVSKNRVDLENARLERSIAKDYSETTSAVAASASTTLDISNGNVFLLSQDTDITTLTISNPASAGTATAITIVRTKDDTATARSITWPASFYWANGTAPMLTQTAEATDVITAVTRDGGVTWLASAVVGFPPAELLPEVAFTDSQTNGSATTMTFESLSFGAAAENRYIIAVVSGVASSGTRTISSATIGGVAANIDIQHAAGQSQIGIIKALVPTGTSGDVVVVWSGLQAAGGVSVYRAINLQSATVTDTATPAVDTSPPLERTANLDVSANGFIIGGAIGYTSGSIQHSSATRTFGSAQVNYQVDVSIASSEVTWTGIDEDVEFAYNTASSFIRATLASYR